MRIAVLYGFGMNDRADELFAQLKARAGTEHVSAAWFALIHLNRGEDDEAIRWLRNGRQNRDTFFASFKVSAPALNTPVSAAVHAELDRLAFASFQPAGTG